MSVNFKFQTSNLNSLTSTFSVDKPQTPELAPPLPLPVSDLPSSYYLTVRNPPTYSLHLLSPERSIQNSRGHGALVAPDRALSLLLSFFSGGTTRKLNPPALIYAPRRLDASLPASQNQSPTRISHPPTASYYVFSSHLAPLSRSFNHLSLLCWEERASLDPLLILSSLKFAFSPPSLLRILRLFRGSFCLDLFLHPP